MRFPVSIIPYANMGPFRALGPPRGCVFEMHTPRQSTVALREGRVLAAPIPVGNLPSVKDEVDFLGSFGIAAAGAVKSVLLFSDRPFAEMAAPFRVYLTDQSSSSVRLLYLLLGYRHGFDNLPYRTGERNEAQGELVIGDEALVRTTEDRGPHVTDLAEAWSEVHRRPFVFARWVIRKDAPPACRESLESWLSEFQAREEELVRESAGPEAARLGLSPDEMLAYLRRMKRILGPEELEGQAIFLQELSRFERSPLFLPEEKEKR